MNSLSRRLLTAVTPVPVEVVGTVATIADRFKLDVPAKGGADTVGRTSTAVAFSAALVALALIGGLAAMLYYHWEYLMSV